MAAANSNYPLEHEISPATTNDNDEANNNNNNMDTIQYSIDAMFEQPIEDDLTTDAVNHVFIPHKLVHDFERSLLTRAHDQDYDHDMNDDSFEFPNKISNKNSYSNSNERNLGGYKIHYCKAPYARHDGVYFRRMTEADEFADESALALHHQNQNSAIEVHMQNSLDIPDDTDIASASYDSIADDDVSSDSNEHQYQRQLGKDYRYMCVDAWKYGTYVGVRYKNKYYIFPPCLQYGYGHGSGYDGSSYDSSYYSYSKSKSKYGGGGYGRRGCGRGRGYSYSKKGKGKGKGGSYSSYSSYGSGSYGGGYGGTGPYARAYAAHHGVGYGGSGSSYRRNLRGGSSLDEV